MGLGNLGNVVFIIFIFVLLHMFLSLSIGISNIRNNWPQHKCNPAVMPFAFIFGHDAISNFDQCVKTTQVDFMSTFLDPIYKSLTYFAQNGAVFTEIFEDLKLFGNSEDNEMFNFAESAKLRLYGIGIALNNIFIGIVDTFSKLSTAVTIIYYVVLSGVRLSKSAWGELPGTFIKIASLGAIK